MTSFLNRRMRSVLLSKFTDRCQGLFEGESGCDYASVVPLCQIGSFTGAAIPFPQHAWGREPCRTALQRSLDENLVHRCNRGLGCLPLSGNRWDRASMLCPFDPACQCVLNLQYRTSPFLRARHPAPQIGCRRWEARRKTVGIEPCSFKYSLDCCPRPDARSPRRAEQARWVAAEFRGAWETPSAFY